MDFLDTPLQIRPLEGFSQVTAQKIWNHTKALCHLESLKM